MSERSNKSRLLRAVRWGLLAFDAFIDSSMFDAGRRALGALSAVQAASERLRLRGFA